jgi:hypothetical protein
MGRIGDADDLVLQHKGGHDLGFGEVDDTEEDSDTTTSNPVFDEDEEESGQD